MNIYLLLIIVRILCDIIVVVSILYPDSGHCYDETNHHHRHTLSPRFAPLLPFSHHHATSPLTAHRYIPKPYQESPAMPLPKHPVNLGSNLRLQLWRQPLSTTIARAADTGDTPSESTATATSSSSSSSSSVTAVSIGGKQDVVYSNEERGAVSSYPPSYLNHLRTPTPRKC